MSDTKTKVESGSSADEQLRHELRRLESYADQLEEARAEMAHELRRCGDALERSGGTSRNLEQLRNALKKNLELLETDLRRNRAQRETLSSEIRPSSIQR